jgi:hypothetical protein
MAGKAKVREFLPIDDLLGKSTHETKLPNGRPEPTDTIGPMSFDAMLTFLKDRATPKEQAQAFTFHWRGLESVASQKIRLENYTVVTVPGQGRVVDLMELADTNLDLCVQVINAHDLHVRLLSGVPVQVDEDDENDEMDEDTEKKQGKNRAWDNARKFLLESGRVIEVNGALAINPEYSAPAVAGASDAEIMEDTPAPKKRGRKK